MGSRKILNNKEKQITGTDNPSACTSMVKQRTQQLPPQGDKTQYKTTKSPSKTDMAPPPIGPARVAWARREAARKHRRRVKAGEEPRKLAPPLQVWIAPQQDIKNEEANCPAMEASLGLKEIEGIRKEIPSVTTALYPTKEVTSAVEELPSIPEEAIVNEVIPCVNKEDCTPKEVSSTGEVMPVSEEEMPSHEKVMSNPKEDDTQFLRRHVPFLTEEQLHSLGPGRHLGAGGYGSVKQLRYEGTEAVVKELLRDGDPAPLLREARVLVNVNGAGGVPRLLAVCQTPPALLQEFLGQTYDYYLDECSVELFLKSLISICQRMEEVHAKGYVHNDIKYNNITFTGAVSDPDLHIIDFGLACHIGEILYKRPFDLTERHAKVSRRKAKYAITGDTFEKFLACFDDKITDEDQGKENKEADDDEVEKCPWMAPEVLGGKPVLPSGDVYSFGYLLEFLMKYSTQSFVASPLRRLSHLCTAWDAHARPSLTQVVQGIATLLQHLTVTQLAEKFDIDDGNEDEENKSVNDEVPCVAQKESLGLEEKDNVLEEKPSATPLEDVMHSLEQVIPAPVEVIPSPEEKDNVSEEKPSATPLDVMHSLEQVIPAPEEEISRPEEKTIKEEVPLVSEETRNSLEKADCVLKKSLSGTEGLYDSEEPMRVIEEEIQAPEEVMLAGERVMTVESFELEHGYEVPCAAHEAPLALTLLLFFYCRRGAACHTR